MTSDFRNHLLMQIEMLRAGISHAELSKRLGSPAECRLASYIAGKRHLMEGDFEKIAKALSIDPRTFAREWAASLGLKVSPKDAVNDILHRAYRDFCKRKRTAGVTPNPSPMVFIRVKYADRLPRTAPRLWFGKPGNRGKGTPEGRRRFSRAYEMLVESVHDNRSHRDIGAPRGISGERARQLMVSAAYTWARGEGIDLLSDKGSVPFKNEARHIKNLYEGLRFFAQQRQGTPTYPGVRDGTAH
jgi:GNAT superfamily N-acetyltransferase